MQLLTSFPPVCSLPSSCVLTAFPPVSLCVQVAHFYNTIDQQMIPSQQPMLLEAALQFENIIKHPKADAGGKVRMDIPTVSVSVSL